LHHSALIRRVERFPDEFVVQLGTPARLDDLLDASSLGASVLSANWHHHHVHEMLVLFF